MLEVRDLLVDIERKINILVAETNQLRIENKQLKARNEKISLELDNKTELITNLEERIRLLRVAKSIKGEGLRKEKLLLNEVVREIDRCIGLLNK